MVSIDAIDSLSSPHKPDASKAENNDNDGFSANLSAQKNESLALSNKHAEELRNMSKDMGRETRAAMLERMIENSRINLANQAASHSLTKLTSKFKLVDKILDQLG